MIGVGLFLPFFRRMAGGPSQTQEYDVFSDLTPAGGDGPFDVVDDAQDYNFGTVFKFAENGFIIGVRYYWHEDDVGNRGASVYEVGEIEPLLEEVITNPNATGWHTHYFDDTVSVVPATYYVVCVNRDAETQSYYATPDFFLTAHVSDDDVVTAVDTAESPNGLFNQALFDLPETNFEDSFYWIDAVFSRTEEGENPTPGEYHTYYVRTSGNDSTGNGSTGNPWLTVTKGVSELSGGDTLIVGDGIYTDTNQLQPPSGSPSNWTKIRSENPLGAVLNHGNYATFRTGNNNYIEIDGFHFDLETGGGGVNSEGGHHITMKNCKVEGGSFHAFASHMGDYYTVDNNVITGQRFSDWWSAISFYQLFNVTDSDDTSFRNVISNNTIYDCYTVSGSLTDGNGIIIDDSHQSQGGGSNPNLGVLYEYDTLVDNNLVVACGGKGIQVAFSDNVTIRNNTCAFNGNPGQEHDDTTWWSEISVSLADHCALANNIAISDPTLHGGNQRNYGDTGLDDYNADTQWFNNLGFDIGGGYSVWINGEGAGPLIGENPLLGTDPEVVSATDDIDTADYQLDVGSPAIDAGTDDFGLATTDLNGDPRLVGAAVDLGAYEVQ